MIIDFLLGRKKGGILNLLKGVKNSLINVDIQYTEPEEVDWKSIIHKISTEAYTPIGNGMYARVIKNPEDIKYDEEKRYKSDLKKANYDRDIVIITLFSKGASFPSHYHDTTEKIKCLEGSFIGLENKVYLPGEVQVVPPNVPHVFKGVTEGVCLVTIKK